LLEMLNLYIWRNIIGIIGFFIFYFFLLHVATIVLMIIDRRIDFTHLKSPKNNFITFENSMTNLIHSKSILTNFAFNP
jgi:hypothetical protein